MKINNKAFTLIELVIVITIMVILVTGTLGGIRSITVVNTKNASRKIDAALSKLRLENMTKVPKSYLYIYNINNALYMNTSDLSNITVGSDNIDESGIRLGNNIRLSYITFYGNRDDLENGEAIRLSFSRSSGAFLSDYEYLILSSSDNANMETIRCIKETGKHVIE